MGFNPSPHFAGSASEPNTVVDGTRPEIWSTEPRGCQAPFRFYNAAPQNEQDSSFHYNRLLRADDRRNYFRVSHKTDQVDSLIKLFSLFFFFCIFNCATRARPDLFLIAVLQNGCFFACLFLCFLFFYALLTKMSFACFATTKSGRVFILSAPVTFAEEKYRTRNPDNLRHSVKRLKKLEKSTSVPSVVCSIFPKTHALKKKKNLLWKLTLTDVTEGTFPLKQKLRNFADVNKGLNMRVVQDCPTGVLER